MNILTSIALVSLLAPVPDPASQETVSQETGANAGHTDFVLVPAEELSDEAWDEAKTALFADLGFRLGMAEAPEAAAEAVARWGRGQEIQVRVPATGIAGPHREAIADYLVGVWLTFRIVAEPSDGGLDLAREREKLQEWRAGHPEAPLHEFNRLPADEGGPADAIDWFGQRPWIDDEGAEHVRDPLPLLRPTSPQDVFSGADLDQVWASEDDYGGPAVGFQMKSSERERFAEFTGRNQKRQMAVLLNDDIATAPRLESALVGQSRITGHFTADEAEELVAALRRPCPPLRLRLIEIRESAPQQSDGR